MQDIIDRDGYKTTCTKASEILLTVWKTHCAKGASLISLASFFPLASPFFGFKCSVCRCEIIE